MTSQDADNRADGSRAHARGASVLLFSAPWMKANWPSLAIGTLKSHLRAGGVEGRCCHLHLEAATSIGWARYDVLAETWGAGEALFGALLEPDDAERLVGVAVELLERGGHAEVAHWARTEGCARIQAWADAWLDRERPERYSVVGGSVGAMQLCSTLYLMRRIRERGHVGTRLLGGSGLVGTVATAVITRFPDVDLVIDGEGEEALLAVCRAVQAGGPLGVPSGALGRDHNGGIVAGGSAAVVDLTRSLPADLDEFFESASALGVPRTGLTLSFEHSRGCEWEHRASGKLLGCTFCGLYRNSADHRRKSVAQVLREIETAVQRHRVLNLAFVDAYLPADYRDELLDGLNRLAGDMTFFTEMRCDLTRSTGERLAIRANRVQLGVESFTTAILKRIDKGVTAARTIYSLRLCQELGIQTQYNLMIRIPGVSRAEVEELTAFLPALFGLPPPSTADFYLDRNSRIFASPEESGLARDALDSERHAWLARSLGDSRISQVVPMPPLDEDLERAWQEVEHVVQRWRECWRDARAAGLPAPLTWKDGGRWATIVDARQRPARVYTIEGVLYDVFAICSEVRNRNTLVRRLPQHSPSDIEKALEALTAHQLLIEDGPQLVSVAMRPHATPRPAPTETGCHLRIYTGA